MRVALKKKLLAPPEVPLLDTWVRQRIQELEEEYKDDPEYLNKNPNEQKQFLAIKAHLDGINHRKAAKARQAEISALRKDPKKLEELINQAAAELVTSHTDQQRTLDDIESVDEEEKEPNELAIQKPQQSNR